MDIPNTLFIGTVFRAMKLHVEIAGAIFIGHRHLIV